MIRLAGKKDCEGIYQLIQSVYSNHSFLKRDISKFIEMLENNYYVSFVYEQEEKILGHAGLHLGNKFGLMNALVVDRKLRGRNIGKKLFNTREISAEQNFDLEFLVGYSMMQHPWSQRLYSDQFKPIGLELYSDEIYSHNDSQFNKGKSNGEIILCRKLREPSKRYTISCPYNQEHLVTEILDPLEFNYSLKLQYLVPENSFFTGFQPDIDKSLFLPSWSKEKQINFEELSVTNKERNIFKKRISTLFKR